MYVDHTVNTDPNEVQEFQTAAKHHTPEITPVLETPANKVAPGEQTEEKMLINEADEVKADLTPFKKKSTKDMTLLEYDEFVQK